jgi:hypothetical protein
VQVVILPQPHSGVQCNEHSMVNPDHLIIKVGMASQEAVLCSKRFRTWLTDRGSVDYHELSCIACLNMGACIALVNLVATPRKHSFANSSGSHCGTIAPTINLTHSNIASDPATLVVHPLNHLYNWGPLPQEVPHGLTGSSHDG